MSGRRRSTTAPLNGGPLLQTELPALDVTSKGSLNLALGVISAKYNIPNTTLLLTGSVLFPLNDNGLKPGLSPGHRDRLRFGFLRVASTGPRTLRRTECARLNLCIL